MVIKGSDHKDGCIGSLGGDIESLIS